MNKLYDSFRRLERGAMTEFKEVEQQIASLAARVDPDAFNRRDDQTLHRRRRAATGVASERVSKVQMLLAVSAAALVCFATAGVYIIGG
jgi:hypothetical protein